MGEGRPRREAEGQSLSEPAESQPAPAPGAAPDGGPWLNFYGRRHGKTLRSRQRDLLQSRLAGLAPPGLDRRTNPDRQPIDLPALFPGAKAVWLEIGFGGGEHLLGQAEANPDVGLIGCEPFMNGVAMLLSALDGRGLSNVRIHAGDVRLLLDVLPRASLGRVFLNYPDPWPKNRHRDRRFVSAANLDALAPLMQPGADMRLATDIPEYVRHALKMLAPRGDFALTDADPAAWAVPWSDWPGTRYEAKALREGRRPHYLTIRRTTLAAERQAQH